MGISPQKKCTLLSALPFEIRRAIFELVLGGRLMHLGLDDYPVLEEGPHGTILKDIKFRRYFCKKQDDADAWSHECWYPMNASREGKDPKEKLLSLLLSCQQIYAEAIDLLYSTNVFHFREMECFRRVQEFIPSKHINTIQSVKLYLYLRSFPATSPEIQEEYEQVWEQLKSMESLKELRVWLVLPMMTEEAWKTNEKAFLDPVRHMSRMDRFDFYLPKDGCEVTEPLDVDAVNLKGADEVYTLALP